MPLYNYKALDSKGKSVKGELEAKNELDVSTQLAKIGYTPVSIGFKGEKAVSFFEKLLKARVKKCSIQSLIVFTRQLATMVKAAVPIIEGLGVLAEQSEDEVLKEALNQVIHDIEGGKRLSESFSKHPGVFNDLYVNSILAGETGGILDKILLRLASVLEEENETKSNIQAALRYPIMVVVSLVIAVIILAGVVMPKFAATYAGLGSALPVPTQVMMLISKILQGPWKGAMSFVWYLILIGMAYSGVFAIKMFIKSPAGRLWWDGAKFKLPIVSRVYTRIVMLRFTTMLNVLYQAGLPILKILDIVKVTLSNVVLAREIEKIKRDVSDGKGISGAILGSKLFPRLVGYMIAVGEKSGSLTMMLDSLCDYYSLEVKNTMRNLTGLIEPLMTAVLGITVAFMALAIFLPMWSLIGAMRG